MFLCLLFDLCTSETHAEVQEIFIGNWTIIESHPTQTNLKTHKYYFNVTQLSQHNSLLAQVYDFNGTMVRNLTMIFVNKSKGTFGVLEKRKLLGNFDFSPFLAPHIESDGTWEENKRYHAIMVNNKIMQLTVYGDSVEDDDGMVVYTFDKLVKEEPLMWYDKYFKYMFMGIVGVLSILLNIFLQSCKIKRYEEMERKKLKKQEKKKNKKKTD